MSRRPSSLILIPLWPAAILTLLGLAMGWRHLAGEEWNVAQVWAVLYGIVLTAILVPAMTLTYWIARWRGVRGRQVWWATLAPAGAIIIWLIFQTGFRSPTRWALNDWLGMYLHIGAPASAKNVRAQWGQAMGGCDGWFSFECTPEDSTKLITDMRVSRTDESRRMHFSSEPEWWFRDAELKKGEYYERTDGPWTYQLWIDTSRTRVLLILGCG